MVTYTSDAVRLKKGVAGPGAAGTMLYATATVTCTSAPTTSDTLQFFYLPAGATVLGGMLEASDMDTAGSPTLTLNAGDAGDPDRLYSLTTIGQAGAASPSMSSLGVNYTYTAKTLIVGSVGTNATTGAAGTVTLTVYYKMD